MADQTSEFRGSIAFGVKDVQLGGVGAIRIHLILESVIDGENQRNESIHKDKEEDDLGQVVASLIQEYQVVRELLDSQKKYHHP